MTKTSTPYQYSRILHTQVERWLEQGSPIELKSIVDCQKGDLLVWPEGLISELIEVTLEEGFTSVTLLHREETGILYERRFKLPCVLPVITPRET